MNFKRLGFLILSVFLFSSSASMAARSPLETPVRATVNAVLRSFQSGNVKLMRAQYLPSSTIVDDHPPFTWSGKNAEDAYLLSFGPFAKKAKMTDLKVSLGAIKHIHLARMTAYVVVPVTATSKVNGAPFTEAGLLVFTLKKTNLGWKIATQSYAENTQSGSHNPY